MPDDISITWSGERPELVINGVRFICRPQEEEPQPWHFPVGEGDYPPEDWYCATRHDMSGALNGGYRHTGIDLNLDVPPWGDVERALGLSVYAIADGVVTYATLSWSGVPMVVIRHGHNGTPLWVRYAHVDFDTVWEGAVVSAGDRLAGFANWRTGDHLHLDMALDEFTREWMDPAIRWRNPVPILKAHLDPAIVDAMLRKG